MGKYQFKHSCPAPEHLKLQQLYAFSINPAWDVKLEKYVSVLHKIFMKMDSIERVVLHPEHSPNGRLHFHGQIVIRDKFNFYEFDIVKLKEFGTFEIDICTHTDKWMKYCNKNSDYIMEACKKYGIQYPFVHKHEDIVVHDKKIRYEWAKQCDEFEESFKLFDNKLQSIALEGEALSKGEAP